MFSGIEIGIFELILYFTFCRILSKFAVPLKLIPTISYYWIMITILTGVWEGAFIFNYYEVSQISNKFNNLGISPTRGKVGEFTPQKVWSSYTKIRNN
mgnify:CR=1 FL=1